MNWLLLTGLLCVLVDTDDLRDLEVLPALTDLTSLLHDDESWRARWNRRRHEERNCKDLFKPLKEYLWNEFILSVLQIHFICITLHTFSSLLCIFQCESFSPRLTQWVMMEKQCIWQNPHSVISFHCQNPLQNIYISIICNIIIML